MEKPTISLAQIAPHNTQQDMWIAVFGKVYDLTTFAKDHPGGIDVLKECAGTDGTEVYEYAGHSESALSVLDRFQVGVLEGHIFETTKTSDTKTSASALASKKKNGAVQRMQQVPGMLRVGGVVLLVALLLVARLFWKTATTRNESTAASSSLADESSMQPVNAFLIGLAVTSSLGFAGLSVAYSKFKETLRQEKEVFEYPAVIPVRR